jgi:alkaline phosphatase
MTRAALNVLDADPDGLFLMVEGGAIDWASHANQSGRVIEEMEDFINAVDAAIEWVEDESSWDETLVVVTSDHECGYLTGPASDPELKPVVAHGEGELPGFEWHSSGHTNALVPLFVRGAGAGRFAGYQVGDDPRHGAYVNNTAVARVVADLYGMPVEELKPAEAR